MTTADVISELNAWKERGRVLAEQLRAERIALLRKVEEIDATLRMMGVGAKGARIDGPPAKRLGRPHGAKSRAVVDFLIANPGSFADAIMAATGGRQSFLAYLRQTKQIHYRGARHHAQWYAGPAPAERA